MATPPSTSPKNSWSSLLSYRHVYNYDYRPLPTKAPIATEEINDFVTTDVKTMTKEEAKAETKDLLKKSFWEM